MNAGRNILSSVRGCPEHAAQCRFDRIAHVGNTKPTLTSSQSCRCTIIGVCCDEEFVRFDTARANVVALWGWMRSDGTGIICMEINGSRVVVVNTWPTLAEKEARVWVITSASIARVLNRLANVHCNSALNAGCEKSVPHILACNGIVCIFSLDWRFKDIQ